MMSSDWIPHPPTPLEEKYPTTPPEKYLFLLHSPLLRNTLKFRKRRGTIGKSRQNPANVEVVLYYVRGKKYEN